MRPGQGMRPGQYVLGAGSSIYGARLSDVSVVIRAFAVLARCRFRDCTIRVEASGWLTDCSLEECDTTIEVGAEEGRNYVEGGSYRDLAQSEEPIELGTIHGSSFIGPAKPIDLSRSPRPPSPGDATMTDRRLPPALEEKVQGTGSADAGWIEVMPDLLDWLYGTLVRGGPVSQATSGLVERVEERLYEDGAQDWQDALRAELGEEA